MLFKKMKKYDALILMLLSLTFVGCSRIELVDKADISLITDWSSRGENVPIPNERVLHIAGQTLTFQNDTTRLPALLPGQYDILVHSSSPFLQVKQGVATAVLDQGKFPLHLDWFFSRFDSITYENDAVQFITAQMQQQVRQLDLVLEPMGGSASQIEKIQVALTGLTTGWDLKHNKPLANSTEVPLSFIKQPNGTWMASIRLLGVVGASQLIQGDISFKKGTPLPLSVRADLSAELKDFNSNKHLPLRLKAAIETPTEAGFTAIINDWVQVNESGTAQ